jgi:hypothetical protein
MSNGQRAGFSLVEVVLAVGVFAVAVTVVLALLPTFAREGAESADQFAAQELAGAINVELKRLAARDGFDALANSIPVMSAAQENGFALVAARDGGRIAPSTEASAPLPPDEQYFQVELWRFKQAPLAYAADGAALVVFVRVSWPYRVRGGAQPSRLADRSRLTFATAINR